MPPPWAATFVRMILWAKLFCIGLIKYTKHHGYNWIVIYRTKTAATFLAEGAAGIIR